MNNSLIRDLCDMAQMFYTWNPRFASMVDSFLSGDPVHNLSKNSSNILDKFIAYADSTLSSADPDYDVIEQYNTHLATL